MGITFADVQDAVKDADLILIQTNHPEFSSEQFVELVAATAREGAVVVDLWNQTDALARTRPDMTVAVLGRVGEVQA